MNSVVECKASENFCKKIKAVRPKMTKIAASGSCSKSGGLWGLVTYGHLHLFRYLKMIQLFQNPVKKIISTSFLSKKTHDTPGHCSVFALSVWIKENGVFTGVLNNRLSKLLLFLVHRISKPKLRWFPKRRFQSSKMETSHEPEVGRRKPREGVPRKSTFRASFRRKSQREERSWS